MDRTSNRSISRGGARSGFTLVEVMIAVTVLMVAVLGAFVAQLGSHNLLRTSRDANRAMADLESAMEQVILLQPDQIPIPGSAFASGQPIAAFTNLHFRTETIVPTYPGYVPGTVPDPLPIVLTCTFVDQLGRQRKLTLSSMKTR
jgi:prepilin-type N-terminal cleavage/methylation domain-containing protein